MKKRILCFILTLALVAQMCITTTLAAFSIESGTCGDNVTWEIDSDYVLTISGTGAMYDFSNYAMFCDVPWQSYLWNITGVVIESGVTSIGTYAFMNCANMTSVSIPATVTTIGDYAFYDCYLLTEITIPDGVKTIGTQAFATSSYQTGVQTITFEGDAPQIPEDAFNNVVATAYYPADNSTWTAEKMQDYGGTLTWEVAGLSENITWTLNNGILTISGTGAMANYNPILGSSYAPWYDSRASITSVVIKEGVTTIGDYAFQDCPLITSVEIPESVTLIGEGAFGRVTGLKSIELPSQLTTIESEAFNSCTGLASLTIPNSVTSVGDSAFGYCEGLTTISIGTGLQDLNYGVFEGCCSLTSVTIPDNIENIGSNAFYCCSALTSITIPDSVTSIGEQAFSSCSALEKVSIGSGVKTIGNYAFTYNSSLKEVTFLGDAPEFEFEFNEWTPGATTFSDVTATCYYPADNATWTTFFVRTDVMDFSFGGNLTWTAVEAEEPVNYCGENLTWTLEDGVLTISGTGDMYHYALMNNDAPWATYATEITGLVIQDGVTGIGDYAFKGLTALNSVDIPNTVVTIGDGAFRESGLTSVSIGSAVTSIGYMCFFDCASLATITVSEDNTVYSVDNAGVLFQNGTYLVIMPSASTVTTYQIPVGTTGMENYAFYGCSKLQSVTIPTSITTISNFAFYDCTSLNSVDIPDSVTVIGIHAFYNCASLQSVEIPGNVTAIRDGAFFVSGLTSITIPASVTTIEDRAFCFSTELTEITFLGNVPTFGTDIFQGVVATCYYPEADTSWAEIVSANNQYGGTLTWTAVEAEETANYCGENLTWTLMDGVLTISGTGAMYNYVWDEEAFTCTAPWCGSEVTQVILGEGVTSIGDYAFYETDISEITIPDGVISIGAHAFSCCYSLGVVTIPASVSSIGDYAFADGSSGVRFEGDAPEISDTAFSYWWGQTAYYPAGNSTWTADVRKDYGAYQLTWKAYGDMEVPVLSVFEVEDTVVSGFTKITAEATDDTGVTEIKLTCTPKGGSTLLIGSMTGSGVYTWDVSELAEGEYTVTAVAYDAAGNQSEPRTLTAIVDNVQPVLTALDAVNSDGGTLFGGKYDTIYLSVSGTNLGGDVTVSVSYPVVDDGLETTEYLEFSAKEIGALSVAGWESGTYTVGAEVRDAAGNTDGLDMSLDITVDNSAPPVPTNLSAIADVLKNTLSWNRSTEADTKHFVYRAESETGERTQLTVVNSSEINQSYVDTAVTAGTTYYYWVTAQDALGNESQPTGPVSVTTLADTTAPWVAAISPVNKSTLAGKVSIVITAEDNIEVKSVKLECSADGTAWTEIGTVEAAKGTFAVDTTQYGETLHLRMTVLDAFNNEYVNAETYSYSIDNTPPEQVTGLTASATPTVVTLNWEDVEAQDFGRFVVQQKESDGTYKQIKTVSDALGVYVTELTPGTEYTFRVYAEDQLGNAGEPSAECTVTTPVDNTAPVISNIQPGPGRYNGDTSIGLTFTVADDYGVGSLSVEYSYDGTQWTQAGTVSVDAVGTSVQVQYSLATALLNEGTVYVRAVATDLYGNIGDNSDSVPYTQYVIDRTAPAAPTSLVASAGQGYIKLTWAQGGEDDLSTYTVYRSAQEDGEFTAISSGLKQLYLVDSDVTAGTSYYYYIDVLDQAGNRSEHSDIVSAVPSADQDSPEVISISPSNGYVMGLSTAIQVKVWDNQQVAALYYQVSTDGGLIWSAAESIEVNAAEKVVSLPLIQKDLTGSFHVKFWCTDAANNISAEVTRNYDLDRTAPAVPTVTATADNMAIQLSWTGGSEEDLSGYRVYRAAEGGSYQLLFQRAGGQSSYSYTDSNVSVGSAYSYYIEAVDIRGNTAAGASSDYVYPIDQDVAAPTAVLDGAVTGATGYEMSFTAARSVDNVGVTAYYWDFGDGTTADTAAVNHAYTAAGTYTVTVTVYDAAGNSDIASMTVTVKSPAAVGNLTIQVKDESGQAVPNAGIYMDLGSEDQSLLYTDSTGVINLRPASGTHTIGVYTDGYLPAKTTVNVVAGVSESITINVVKKDIVEGELTVERMTLEQIKAAGIDVNDPANQFVYEFNIKLTYGTYDAYVSAQYNGEGEALKNPDPVQVVDNNGETRYLSINVIPVRPGGGGGGGDDDGTSAEGGGGVGTGQTEQEVPMVVIMDIPGKASWLKDFFDVRLTVINQADSEFVLDDCLAYLNVPSGLTLMETIYTKAEASYDMGSIVGGNSGTAHWILRGDVGGEYNLTADFSAVLREFGTKISARFQTAEPFRVRQGDGLTLDLVVENAILADTDGSIKVGLRNDDEFPYYLPDLTLDESVVTLVDTYKTNGRVKVDTDRDTLYTGETIWWEYIVPREHWESLTTYSDEDFYLMDAIVEATGGNAKLPYTVQNVMPFSINGDRIEVTRVSSGGGEAQVSYLNIDKNSAFSAKVPDLMIRTYRKNEDGEYVPASMSITIKDGYVISKGKDSGGNEVSEDGITVTTDANGEYTYKGYSLAVLDNEKSFNIRVSASRAYPVDIPVVIRGETAETGLLTVYVYTGSGKNITVLEGATVTVLNVNGEGEDLTDPTDAEGVAEFKKVPQGKQEVRIEKNGYLPVTAVVDVGNDTEVSYRLYADDDPTSSRIIQITNDLSGWGSGNQTIFPEGRVTGTVTFRLTKRIAEGETFEQYCYRITSQGGAVQEGAFASDDGFWLELEDLKAGDKLEFAVETDKGVSPYVDANLIVTPVPDFFDSLVYNLTQIQMGGKVDFTKGFEFDPSEAIEDFTAASIAEGVAVKDDEKGYQAVAIEQTNAYTFTKTESKRIYPLSAKYDMSGKLTLSVILGGEKESSTVSGGSYASATYIETPDYVAYQGVVAVAEEESDKKKVSGQLQVDFVYQYDPAKNGWTLTVYGKISAEQSFTLLEATFLKVGYVSADLKFEESATLELMRNNVGPEEKIEVLGNGLIPKEMKASGELKTSVGAKAISKKVASVGAYMKVGLEFQLLPYLALRASAALGAEGSVLIWSKEKDLISNTWEFSGDAEPVALATFALYDLRSNTEDTLALASAGAQPWQVNRGAWIANAYEQAEPQLVALSDGSILAVWCGYTDDENGPVALYWSVCQDGTWSETARVDADGTADLYPSLIVTDETVQLVWVDFTDSVAEMDNLTYTEIQQQAFQMLGVTTACFTGSDWTVAEAYTGGTLAANPKVAVGEDGSTLVSWIANDGDLEVATEEYPDYISWVRLDEEGNVQDTGDIDAPVMAISDLGIGYDSENGYQLTVLAENADGMTKLYHAELHGDTWTNLTMASSIDSADSAMAMAADGTVYTINSDRIYSYKDGVCHHLLRSDLLSEGAGELTCVETAQGTVLLWVAILDTDSAICMTMVDENGVASQPIVVAATDEGLLSAPSAAADDSELTVMFQSAAPTDGMWTHNVLQKTFVLGVDLSLENSLIRHSGYVIPGARIESYVEVDTLGVTIPDSFTVEVYSVAADGTETVIAEETGSNSLNLTLKWTVPEDYAGEDMYFRVVADADSNSANDTILLNNLIRELAVSDPVYVGYVDGEDVFTINVENQGLVTSEETTLTVQVIGSEGEALLTTTVAELEPGAKQTIRLTLADLDRTAEVPLVFMVDPLTGEGDLSNNNEYLILTAHLDYLASTTANGVTTQYTSLEEAVESAEEGAVVSLLDDVALSEALTIAPEQDITLDLNGFTIDSELENADDALIICKGTLTLTDGTINGVVSVSGALTVTGALTLNGESEVCDIMLAAEDAVLDLNACTGCKDWTLANDTDADITVTIPTGYSLIVDGAAASVLPADSTANIHFYNAQWNYDETGHWHECACGDKADFAAHTPGAEATETTAQTCTGCGYEINPALGHVHSLHLTKTEAEPATCTEPGNEAYWSCACGKYFSDAEGTTEITKDSWIIPATGHDLTKTEAEPATCTELGNEAYWSCACGKYFSDAEGTTEIAKDSWIIPATGHDLTKTDAEPATCTEPGNEDYWTCSCGKYFSDAEGTTEIAKDSWVIPATGHDHSDDWSKDKTGHWHECDCGDKADFAEHTPGAEATETTAQTCTICGYEINPALGHVHSLHLTKTAAQEESCTEPGNSAYWTCSCGKYFSDETAATEIAKDSWVIPATGHDHSDDWSKDEDGHWHECDCGDKADYAEHTPGAEATETTAQTCTICGYEINPALGHVHSLHLTKTAAQEESCTEPGNSAYWTCSCGKYFSDENAVNEIAKDSWVIPATGHDHSDDWSKDEDGHWHECDCGDKADYAEHTPGAEATETTDQTCTECGHVITPALGHVHGNHLTKTEANPATCTEPGNNAYWTCSCGKYFSDENAVNEIAKDSWIIPATGHDWADAWSFDDVGHWHVCQNTDCTVTDSADMDGYSEHVYTNSADAICDLCGFKRDVVQVSELPVSVDVPYLNGLDLTDIDLTAGTVTDTEGTPISGTWSWADPDTTLYAGTTSFEVIFTPEDPAVAPISAHVEVTIPTAEQTLTSEHATPDAICTSYAGPGLELKDMVTSNLDVQPVFSVIVGTGYVEGTVLYSSSAGFVTVKAEYPAVDVNGDGINEYNGGSVEIHAVFTTVPMYRMYDPNSGEHVYTGSLEEVANLKAAGWNEEGIAFNFPALGAPVYRLYDGRLPTEGGSGDHLYTMDQEEINRLIAQGWNNEGVAFNSADTAGGVAQYRLYNPNAHLNGTRGAWHFTSSIEERDYLISLGWVDQGIGWYSEWA